MATPTSVDRDILLDEALGMTEAVLKSIGEGDFFAIGPADPHEHKLFMHGNWLLDMLKDCIASIRARLTALEEQEAQARGAAR
ncbi:hypothetical protein [Sphingomonas sp. ID0503]|uniref:hypothetical protein n=1 Tax=Sphingomonas sp. ID0503 TaxID=3399691 RepID=UPI003AFA37AE